MEDDQEQEGADTRPDMTGHRVTVAEAVRLFADAGVPRNERTIRRYCRRGDLLCVTVDNEFNNAKYMIDAASIDQYVVQLQQLQPHVRTRPDETAPERSGQDKSGHVRSEPDVTGQALEALKQEYEERITDLERQNRELEIDKRVRQGLVDRLDEERKRHLDDLKDYVHQLTEQSRKIGVLETRLLALASGHHRPEPDTLYRDDETDPTHATEHTQPHVHDVEVHRPSEAPEHRAI